VSNKKTISPLFKNKDRPHFSDGYKNIRDFEPFADGKELMEKLWEDFAPFADKQFLDEMETNLKSRFWEMYLGCSFLYNNFNLELPNHTGGPDLKINFKNKSLWIEAVTPQKGKGDDKLEELPNMVVVNVPHDKMILRIQNSIEEKKRKYAKWIDNKVANKNEPFILAINGTNIQYTKDYEDELPLIIRSVSAFGKQYYTFDINTMKVVDSGYKYEDSIKKQSGTVINKNLLSDKRYSIISAFLYSCVDPLNRPKNMGDDYILLHNPLAQNKLPIGFLKLGREYYRGENELKMNDYRIEKVN